jgi:hypothetical protein
MKKRETFQSPYDQYKQHIGKPFEILYENAKNVSDPEASTTYKIRIDDQEIDALPEEIYEGDGWEPNNNTTIITTGLPMTLE